MARNCRRDVEDGLKPGRKGAKEDTLTKVAYGAGGLGSTAISAETGSLMSMGPVRKKTFTAGREAKGSVTKAAGVQSQCRQWGTQQNLNQ